MINIYKKQAKKAKPGTHEQDKHKQQYPQLRYVKFIPMSSVNTSMDIEKHKTMHLSDISNLCFVAT